MKRTIVIVLCMVICLLLTLTACNVDPPEDDVVVVSADMLSNNLYEYNPNSNITEDIPYDLRYSCRDDENYYYGFGLGTIKNVIVDDNPYNTMRYMGPANIKTTYSTSKVSSTSIEKQSSWLKERLEYDDKLAGESGEGELGVLELFSVKAAGSRQYYSNTTTTTNSAGEIVKQEVTVTESQSVEITFDDTCPYGDYRIIHVMDYDVFVIATKVIKTGEIKLNLLTLPKTGIIELYEYSENGFEEIKLPELDFDSSIINNLPVPTEYIKSNEEFPSQSDEPDGTPGKPYKISNAKELAVYLKNDSNKAEKTYYKLVNDIDASEYSWNSIDSFKGELDGDGHKVSHLKIKHVVNINSNIINVGFVQENKGTIKNIVFEDVQMNIEHQYDDSSEKRIRGGIVGTNTNVGKIENVQVVNSTFNLSINIEKDDCGHEAVPVLDLGAIAGWNDGNINYCTVRATTLNGYSDGKHNKGIFYSCVGGFVGTNNKSISNCISTNLTVKSIARGGYYVFLEGGGNVYSWAGYLTGCNGGTVNNCVIYDQKSIKSEAIAVANYMGIENYWGLVSGNNTGTFENVFAMPANGLVNFLGNNSNAYSEYVKSDKEQIASIVKLWDKWSYKNGDFIIQC